MPQALKSTDPEALSKMDSFLTQFRHEAAHSGRSWELRYEKDEELGSSLSIHLDPAPEVEAKK